MTVSTEGPIRGFLGRWLMRFEVSRSIQGLFFQGTTAVSALGGVLSYAGYSGLVLPILAVWLLSIPTLAYIIADGGILNRKNREKSDYGNNFATPRDVIDDTLIGVSYFAAKEGRKPTEEEREIIVEAVREQWSEFRNGVDLD